jgi:hypothetical protein
MQYILKVMISIFLFLAVYGAPKPEAMCITNLQSGHTLRVRYESTGCFHFNAYEFDFVGGPVVSVNITKVERKLDKKRVCYVDSRRVPMGSLTLGSQDIRKLDNLISYYRSKPHGFCTTVDDVKILHYVGKKIISSESYSDASCTTHDMKDVVTFNQLISRIK